VVFHDKEHVYFYEYYERNPSVQLSCLADLIPSLQSSSLEYSSSSSFEAQMMFDLVLTPGLSFFGSDLRAASVFFQSPSFLLF